MSLATVQVRGLVGFCLLVALGCASPPASGTLADAATPACPPTQTDCRGSCRDLSSDSNHCGMCGRACAAGQVCSSGMCVVSCSGGTSNCGGVCRDLTSDSNHCGMCGRACAAGQSCTAGVCSGGASLTQRSCAAGTPGCGMVRVPGGTFTLGDSVASGAQPPRTHVTVSPFAIDRYEVTVARFRTWVTAGRPTPTGPVNYRGVSMPFEGTVNTVMELGNSILTSPDARCNWNATGGARDNHPMNCVNWATAQAFCVWDGNGTGRLPTEAEWEFAARGTDGRPWPWGPADDDTRSCDSRRGSRSGTCAEDDPAFAAGASPFGALHMVGNVWEWCADWYADYRSNSAMCWSAAPTSNPLCNDRAGSGSRVIRGGSWLTADALVLRAASRFSDVPGHRHSLIGFRCARDTP